MPNDSFEPCPECDSISVYYRFVYKRSSQNVYEGICRDCGASWEEWDGEEHS